MSDTSFSRSAHCRQPLGRVDEAWLLSGLSDDEIEVPAEGEAEDPEEDCDDDRETARPGEDDLSWGDLGLDAFVVPQQRGSR